MVVLALFYESQGKSTNILNSLYFVMRLIISTLSRFHIFDLAEQMRQRGHLTRLYTAFPMFKVDRPLRPFASTFPWVYCSRALILRLGWYQAGRYLNWPTRETFDRWVADHIEPCDVFVHLSSFGLYTARRAKILGARVVCDRGSAHIVYQDKILAQEYACQRVSYCPIDSRVVEKELQEYVEADLVTVPSSFAYRSFLERGVPAQKLRKLPYGVSLSLFYPLSKEDTRFRVIFVGSYSIQKGIGYLLEAVRPLVQKKAAELWLVGNASPEAREILRRNADIFTDKGSHPRAKLSWFYSQASVLVLPSIQEGLAMVQAQAMACGIPVIATANTGAEDLFTDGVEGFIVPIRDPKAIREKIEWMLDNPIKRQEMAEAALRRVKSLGGWNAYGEGAAKIYAELLNERSE